MKFGRNVALPAAVACMLSSPFALLPYAAQADELSDMQQKNQQLQQRLDQLAQAIPGAGGFYTQGAPPAPTAGAGTVGGSFPRSFLIPGSDTSLRIGGEIRENLTYWFTGRNPNLSPASTNVLNNGGINNAQVDIHNVCLNAACTLIGPSSNPTRSKNAHTFYQSPQQSKMSVETRTPTAFGEARTFLEFDFAGGGDFAPGGTAGVGGGASGPLKSTNSLVPRLRYAYGTLGGFLFGQANSNFSDPDADPPQLEFGGQVGNPGVTRQPQIRYTLPLQPYGFLGALSGSVESPETDTWTQGFGQLDVDTGAIPITAAGGLNEPGFNPLKSSAPDLTAAWYIPQPWGHLDMSLVYRPTLQFKDGRFVDRTFSGYGGHIGGDVKPGWFGWAKDDFTFHAVGGEGIGRYLGGNSSVFSLVSNYPTAAIADKATAAAVQIKSVMAFGGNISYTHWWTDTIRSYAASGIHHQDVPNNLRTSVPGGSTGTTPVCPGGLNAARLSAAGGCNINKELVSASFGTIWSPVSFVDVGLEYAYGHRLTLSGLKGDTSAIVNRYTIRF